MSRVKGRNYEWYREIAFKDLRCKQISEGSNGTVEVLTRLGIYKTFINKIEFISWVKAEQRHIDEMNDLSKL